jgi:adenylate kinase
MRLVLFGPPGSGKGTQGAYLSEHFGVPTISTGEILRDHVRRGTELGQKAEPIMNSGALMPDDILIAIVRDRLAEPDAAAGFILDGFPRTIPQAQALDGALSELGKPLDRVVYLKVSEPVLEERLGGRWTCSCCGRVYSGAVPPARSGACDDDGTELMQREDDRPEAVTRRIRTYLDQTMPVLEYYRSLGKVLEVNGELPVEEVRAQLVEKLSPFDTAPTNLKAASA